MEHFTTAQNSKIDIIKLWFSIVYNTQITKYSMIILEWGTPIIKFKRQLYCIFSCIKTQFVLIYFYIFFSLILIILFI